MCRVQSCRVFCEIAASLGRQRTLTRPSGSARRHMASAAMSHENDMPTSMKNIFVLFLAIGAAVLALFCVLQLKKSTGQQRQLASANTELAGKTEEIKELQAAQERSGPAAAEPGSPSRRIGCSTQNSPAPDTTGRAGRPKQQSASYTFSQPTRLRLNQGNPTRTRVASEVFFLK